MNWSVIEGDCREVMATMDRGGLAAGGCAVSLLDSNVSSGYNDPTTGTMIQASAGRCTSASPSRAAPADLFLPRKEGQD